MEFLEAHIALPLVGAGAGVVLGFVARVNRFCTLSSLERYWYSGDGTGLRTWILASVVALLATQALDALDLIDLRSTHYLTPFLGLIGVIVGGVMFGLGMALVGTCAFGAVVRLGGGSLRSLVVLLVIGLAAISTQRGLAGQARVTFVDAWAIDLTAYGDQSMATLASAVLGFDATILVIAVLAGGALIWVFSDRRFLRRSGAILCGVSVGLVIAFGWWATSYFATVSFQPVQIEAGSFAVPVGDSILQVITYTGSGPDYGVGLVIGCITGAALGAWYRHDGRWEACDDARELSRHLAGGALMGVGAVLAMGCTIGQGLSGMSTLALSAPLAFASILLGARLGLSWLIEGSPWAAFGGRSSGQEPAE